MEPQHESMNAFVTEEAGPSGVFGVFEDDGEAGYLYLYEPGDREVFNHLHIYDRNTNLQVREQDVRVIWSEDHSKVGVVIWGKLRGVINLVTGREGRVWLEDVNTPGIGDAQWLKGFRM